MGQSQKEKLMKKHFNRRWAGTLAVALVATSALTLLTPPLKSDNLISYSLFSDNSNLSIVANAATPVQLTNTDFDISSGTIKGFSPAGFAKLAGADEGTVLDFSDVSGVTKIGDNAFKGNFTNENIGIKLPDSITDIGKEAFRDNTMLTSIEFGNNLQKIGDYAFFQDSRITSIDLGSNIKSVGHYAFKDCQITGELKLPNSLTNLEDGCFGANKITKVVIPTTITKIPSYAFALNKELDDVTLHDGITVIGSEAFKECKITGPLQLPSYLEELGHKCYENNYITYISLPASIQKIGRYVFADNEITSADLTNLANVQVEVDQDHPARKNAVPWGMFANQNSNKNYRKQTNKLTSITFPDSIDTIGQEAFKGNGFTSYRVPENVKTICLRAFEENESLTSLTLHDKIKSIGNSAFNKCSIKGEIQLPGDLITLGNSAFYDNKGITKVTFPDGLINLGSYVFWGNPVTEVNWGKFDKIKAEAKYEYTTYASGIVIPEGLFSGHRIKNLILPEKITAIGGRAFQSQCNVQIDNLSIPAGVKIIGVSAFNEVPINTLTFLGNNVELIDKLAFSSSHIKSGGMAGNIVEGNMTIPESIKKIGTGAFSQNSLRSLTFGNNEIDLGESAFSTSLERLSHRESATLTTINGLDASKLGDSVFMGLDAYTGLKNVTFDYAHMNSTFTSSGNYTFNKGALRSINYPAQISEIKNSAFDKNTGWYNHNYKVGLYRVGTDGTTYITDNAVSDGNNYVFNPVLVAFKLVDQDGNELSKSLLPESVKGKRFRPSDNSSTDFVATTTSISGKELVDYNNFKLADKVEFVLPATPAGYTFEGVTVSDTTLAPVTPGNNKYEVELDPNNSNVVVETPYDDTYKVGYKKTVITLKYKKTSGGTTNPDTPVNPDTPSNPDKPTNPDKPVKPDKPTNPDKPANPGTPSNPDKPTNPDKPVKPDKPTNPDKPANPGTPSNPDKPTTPSVEPSVPVVPLPDNPGTPTTPDTPANPDIPTVNPPTNVPFTPETIVNPDLIPEGDPTFNIVNEEDTPLGDAKIDKNKGTYTFVDDNSTPKGLAKIHDDNTLEVVKVYDDKAPKGTLPQTGGNNGSDLVLLGAAMLGLGVIIRKKLNK